MEMHCRNRQQRIIFCLFSGYNKAIHGFTQHILVCHAHRQAISRLLGGLSGLPAPLPSSAAFARSCQSFRRRLIVRLRPHSFIGLNYVQSLWAEGINTQHFLKRG
jgi:hypothetical protein